jgi:hypothetical protein
MTSEANTYKDKILAAVTEALFKASVSKASDGTKNAIIMSGEIIDALLTVQKHDAGYLAERKFTDTTAAVLRRAGKAALQVHPRRAGK